MKKKDFSSTVILIRIAVGLIFLSEGIQKFLFEKELGAGRFLKIGIPFPAFTGPFVGGTEIICGLAVLLGIHTKKFSFPLIIIMAVAVVSTKVVNIPEIGFWETAHNARTDFAMLLSSIFLFLSGGGKYSLDDLINQKNIDNDN